MRVSRIQQHSPLTEQRMLAALANGEVRLPGVDISVRGLESHVRTTASTELQADAVVDVSWQSKTFPFIVKCKARSTPKLNEAAIGQAMYYSRLTGLHPMILVPYLSPQELDRLNASGVSGVDLSGNGIISVPGEMLIYKTGAPNLYPERKKRSNPYRGASSLVARTLAVRSEFDSARGLEAFIRERGGLLTQGTVSKVLDYLEEDLVIGRRGRSIRVLQYDVLLDNLVRNFERPDPRDARTYKVAGSTAEVARQIMERASETGEKVVVTGIGSASHYTAMAQSPPVPIYCSRLELMNEIADPASRFPNVSVMRMADAGTYYDGRFEDGWPWASPLQTYIELMNGSARDREMADHVRGQISPGTDVQIKKTKDADGTAE